MLFLESAETPLSAQINFFAISALWLALQLGARLSGRTATQRSKKGSENQRTPWGGGKRRGVENLTNDTPPKKGFWTPPPTVRFPPPSGPKIFGRARSLVRFLPPIRFAPPHITAQEKVLARAGGTVLRKLVLCVPCFVRGW